MIFMFLPCSIQRSTSRPICRKQVTHFACIFKEHWRERRKPPQAVAVRKLLWTRLRVKEHGCRHYESGCGALTVVKPLTRLLCNKRSLLLLLFPLRAPLLRSKHDCAHSGLDLHNYNFPKFHKCFAPITKELLIMRRRVPLTMLSCRPRVRQAACWVLQASISHAFKRSKAAGPKVWSQKTQENQNRNFTFTVDVYEVRHGRPAAGWAWLTRSELETPKTVCRRFTLHWPQPRVAQDTRFKQPATLVGRPALSGIVSHSHDCSRRIEAQHIVAEHAVSAANKF